jgi:hypothetical protein
MRSPRSPRCSRCSSFRSPAPCCFAARLRADSTFWTYPHRVRRMPPRSARGPPRSTVFWRRVWPFVRAVLATPPRPELASVNSRRRFGRWPVPARGGTFQQPIPGATRLGPRLAEAAHVAELRGHEPGPRGAGRRRAIRLSGDRCDLRTMAPVIAFLASASEQQSCAPRVPASGRDGAMRRHPPRLVAERRESDTTHQPSATTSQKTTRRALANTRRAGADRALAFTAYTW